MAHGSDGNGGGGSRPLLVGWQETGLEPFRPDPSLKSSSNLQFNEEGDGESIRVTCTGMYPDRTVAFAPVLSSGCFEVEFLITKGANLQMDIGVLPSDTKPFNWRSDYLYKHGYTLSSSGKVYARNAINYASPLNISATAYRAGDKVRLRLDMNKRKMWIAINSGEMLKVADGLPGKLMVALGVYNINCEVVVTPLSSMDGGNGASSLSQGLRLYAPLWLPPPVHAIISRANGKTEAASDAVVAVMRSIAELCGQQSYPAQVPSILGAPVLLSAPLCIDGKDPEMLEQLVEMAQATSHCLSRSRRSSSSGSSSSSSSPGSGGGGGGGAETKASFLLLSTLRVIRANLHRILLSGVDQRWLQLSDAAPGTSKFSDPKLHPWRFPEAEEKKQQENAAAADGGLHFLQRLHLILAGIILGDVKPHPDSKAPLNDEAARTIAMAFELFYPTTLERLEMVRFLIGEKFQSHPMTRAIRMPVLEALYRTDRLCTLLIPEPIKIPRRLRMSTGEELGMSPEEEALVQKDKARFEAEIRLLIALLLDLSDQCIDQGRDIIRTLHEEVLLSQQQQPSSSGLKRRPPSAENKMAGSAAPSASPIPLRRLTPGMYVVKPGIELAVQRTAEIDSAEVARLKPLTKIRVVETARWKDSDIIRGRILTAASPPSSFSSSSPSTLLPRDGWVSLFDLEKTVYWAGHLPSQELELLYTLHRHLLTWASSYSKVLKDLDKMDLPDGPPDIEVTVALDTGELCIVRMNRKDRVASLKEKLLEHLPAPPSSPIIAGPPPRCMDLHFNGSKLNDEHTLDACGIKNKSKVTHKSSRIPSLRRTLSAFKPRSKEQAKASLFAAKAVERALHAYSKQILKGNCTLSKDVVRLCEDEAAFRRRRIQRNEGKNSDDDEKKSNARSSNSSSSNSKASKRHHYSMQTYKAMEILRNFLGALGGPLVLTAVSSSSSGTAASMSGSSSIEAAASPNTLKLSQESVESLIDAIAPLVPIAVPILPSIHGKLGGRGSGLGDGVDGDQMITFDKSELAPHVTLSNGGLTVEKKLGSNGQWNTVRLSQWMPRNSGKYSFDFTIDAAPSKWIFIGCASEAFTRWKKTSNSYLGYRDSSWGYSMGGGSHSTVLYGTARSPDSYKYKSLGNLPIQGDRITVHVDTDNSTISYDKNGVPLGKAFQFIKFNKLAVGVTLYHNGDRVTFAPRNDQFNCSGGPAHKSTAWRVSAKAPANDRRSLWKLARLDLFSNGMPSAATTTTTSKTKKKALASYVTASRLTTGAAKRVIPDVKSRADGSFLSGSYTFEFKDPVAVRRIALTNHAKVRSVQHFKLEFFDEDSNSWRLCQAFRYQCVIAARGEMPKESGGGERGNE
eukprot:jgi/Bigna1/131669/aug1.15_g6377